MPRIKKTEVPVEVEKVTLIGVLRLTHLDRPLVTSPEGHVIGESEDDVETADTHVGFILFNLDDGTTIALDRAGFNVGVDKSKVEEILAKLSDTWFEAADMQIYPIVKGDGKHKSHYSAADAKEIITFLKQSPIHNRATATAFTSKLA